MVMFREEARRSRRPIGPVPNALGPSIIAPITGLPSAASAYPRHSFATASPAFLEPSRRPEPDRHGESDDGYNNVVRATRAIRAARSSGGRWRGVSRCLTLVRR